MKRPSYFRDSQSFSHFGFYTLGTTLIMIFLLTFLAVSLSTAGANYRMAKDYATQTTAYYQAEEKIYDHLAYVDRLLTGAYISAQSEADYFFLAKSQLSTSDYGTFEGENSHYTITLEEKITDSQTLLVVLEIQYPEENSDCFYHIVKWQSIENN